MILMTCTEDYTLRPANRAWAARAAEQWTIGDRYMVDAQDARSVASHNHYFASIHEIFVNLSDEMSERFASSEALRKYALIRTGYRDERSIACASKAEAARVAAFIRPMDDFAVVVVSEAVVSVYTAKSQSRKAMGGKVFQESKAAVLDFLAGLIGVKSATVESHVSEVPQ